MTPSRPVLARALTAALLAAGLAACGGGPKKDAQYVEQPVELIYNRAADLLDQRRWSEAIAGFDEVERQHPFSSWARRSILMGAYARYRSSRYDEAIEAARRFIALHPGSDSAAYAYHMIAICYFEQILDVGRDQYMTEMAMTSLQDVVRRFPNTDYARDAQFKLDMAYDQLAGKEMSVGRFYLRRDQHLAAANRFLAVVTNADFQRTTHTPEALHRLVETYLSLGMIDEARKMAAVLGYNYGDTEWYERTYRLMTAKNLRIPKYGQKDYLDKQAKLAQKEREEEQRRSEREALERAKDEDLRQPGEAGPAAGPF